MIPLAVGARWEYRATGHLYANQWQEYREITGCERVMVEDCVTAEVTEHDAYVQIRGIEDGGAVETRYLLDTPDGVLRLKRSLDSSGYWETYSPAQWRLPPVPWVEGPLPTVDNHTCTYDDSSRQVGHAVICCPPRSSTFRQVNTKPFDSIGRN